MFCSGAGLDLATGITSHGHVVLRNMTSRIVSISSDIEVLDHWMYLASDSEYKKILSFQLNKFTYINLLGSWVQQNWTIFFSDWVFKFSCDCTSIFKIMTGLN